MSLVPVCGKNSILYDDVEAFFDLLRRLLALQAFFDQVRCVIPISWAFNSSSVGTNEIEDDCTMSFEELVGLPHMRGEVFSGYFASLHCEGRVVEVSLMANQMR